MLHQSSVTPLVGVSYDASTYIDFSSVESSDAFKWTSNYRVTDHGTGIGGINTAWFGYIPPGFTPASGGYSDDYPVPAYTPLRPITFKSIESQHTLIGKKLSVAVIAYDLQEGANITYSISHDAPAGLKIDPATGSLSFLTQTIGTYPVTVNAVDQMGHSASATFNVTVLPIPNPPKLTLGANEITTTLTPFTRTGSFQDATATAPFKATVDYGDGTPILRLPLNSNNTFNLSHIYSTTGNYTVTVSVTDANGLTGTSHFVVAVTQPFSGLGAVPDAFVTSLYREVLGRSPELSGFRFWASKFIANVRRATIVNAFFGSAERRSLVHQGVAPKITPARALADADRAAQKAKS
jgi:hypothetical protein